MSKFNIEITEPAEKDIYEIRRYITEELLEASIAKKVINKIGETIISLEEYPLRHSLVIDERLSELGIRKILIDNYVIFYIVDEKLKTVTIIRILYGKRDWLSLL